MTPSAIERTHELRPTHNAPGAAGRYLTFALEPEEYGLPVLRVREIIKAIAITTVPQAPPDIRGVINLRGRVIPVTDLRTTFGLPPRDITEQTSIIVVQIATVDRARLVGVLVDHVSDVLSITEGEIDPAPPFGRGAQTAFILGLAKVKGTVKILLDLDYIFDSGTPAGVPDCADPCTAALTGA